MSDNNFRLVMSASELAPAPPLRNEVVELPECRTISGEAAGLMVWELSALDHAQYQESLRIYKNGVLTSVSLENDDLKYLAFCVRDNHNNRLWPKIEDAVRQLGEFGKATIDRLLAAANRVNGKGEDAASAEGNSDEAQSGS